MNPSCFFYIFYPTFPLCCWSVLVSTRGIASGQNIFISHELASCILFVLPRFAGHKPSSSSFIPPASWHPKLWKMNAIPCLVGVLFPPGFLNVSFHSRVCRIFFTHVDTNWSRARNILATWQGVDHYRRASMNPKNWKKKVYLSWKKIEWVEIAGGSNWSGFDIQSAASILKRYITGKLGKKRTFLTQCLPWLCPYFNALIFLLQLHTQSSLRLLDLLFYRLWH